MRSSLGIPPISIPTVQNSPDLKRYKLDFVLVGNNSDSSVEISLLDGIILKGNTV